MLEWVNLLPKDHSRWVVDDVLEITYEEGDGVIYLEVSAEHDTLVSSP